MVIKLPIQKVEKPFSLEQAIRLRATKRDYLDKPISLEHISKLLFAAQGRRATDSKLVTPSAQEQYPVSTYLLVRNAKDLAEGLYQYNNLDHSVNLITNASLSGLLELATLGEQPWVSKAAAVIILASNINSMNEHFADQPPVTQRGERYCYIEVGAIAQNVQLQGTALNIGMVLVGGFDNEKMKALLKLPTELEPSALLCLGNV